MLCDVKGWWVCAADCAFGGSGHMFAYCLRSVGWSREVGIHRHLPVLLVRPRNRPTSKDGACTLRNLVLLAAATCFHTARVQSDRAGRSAFTGTCLHLGFPPNSADVKGWCAYAAESGFGCSGHMFACCPHSIGWGREVGIHQHLPVFLVRHDFG